jgi:hypothetical protein
MAYLNEIAQWTELIYQLAIQDEVLGGPDGPANIQPRQLADRTQWLKQELARNTAADAVFHELIDRLRWKAAYQYAANEPVFFEGKPYYANPDNLPAPGQNPLDYPEKWIPSGGDGLKAQVMKNWRYIETLWNEVFKRVVDANTFNVFFDTLDGVDVASGIWNEAEQRMEC